MADNGLITIASHYNVKDTVDRLDAAIRSKGMTIFARVDHAAGAAAVGMPLRPTELLIFGNARGGTPLMELEQTIGIDLPLKALAWEDASGKTWLSYNDTTWLAARHWRTWRSGCYCFDRRCCHARHGSGGRLNINGPEPLSLCRRRPRRAPRNRGRQIRSSA
jgi:uncharacterized protein (DUF302 family)